MSKTNTSKGVEKFLAAADTGQSFTVANIAKRLKKSYSYAFKLLSDAKTAGLVKENKGQLVKVAATGRPAKTFELTAKGKSKKAALA